LTLLVLRAASGGDYTVVGADAETLPSPLPTGGVATFALSTPIPVAAGDQLALDSTDETSPAAPVCYFSGGSAPADMLTALMATTPPMSGQTLSLDTAVGQSPGGFALDVAATLVQAENVGVATTAGPSTAVANRLALLSATVSNLGGAAAPITFVDYVPAGVPINSAVAGDGACVTSGQTVT
jgi:hypothetical protein